MRKDQRTPGSPFALLIQGRPRMMVQSSNFLFAKMAVISSSAEMAAGAEDRCSVSGSAPIPVSCSFRPRRQRPWLKGLGSCHPPGEPRLIFQLLAGPGPL